MVLKLPASDHPGPGGDDRAGLGGGACPAPGRAAWTGKKVVVLGAGTIGNLVGQVARASGRAKVMITDVSEYKLEKARTCGFEHAVNPSAGRPGPEPSPATLARTRPT